MDLWDVLVGKRYVTLRLLFVSYHQDLVRRRLQNLSNAPDTRSRSIVDRKTDEVTYVELFLIWRVQLITVQEKLGAAQGCGEGTIPDAFEVYQETLWRLA